jgi:hypothetical protein
MLTGSRKFVVLIALFLMSCGAKINDGMEAVLIEKEIQREQEAPGELNIAHECRTAPLDVFKDKDGHTIIICAVPGGYGVINMTERKIIDVFSFEANSLSDAKRLLSR